MSIYSSKPLLVLCIGLLAISAMLVVFPGLPVGAVDCSTDYTISFLGSTPVGPNITFSYEVSVAAGAFKIKDWILELPPYVIESDIDSVLPDDWDIDGKGGLRGLKFKADIQSGDCVTFSMTLKGNWVTGVARAVVKPDTLDWCQMPDTLGPTTRKPVAQDDTGTVAEGGTLNVVLR